MEEKKPIKKTTAKKTTAKTQVEKKLDQIAVFSSGKLFHPSLGRLSNGYSILDTNIAEEWMKISKKVREATPQEVASAYGV
jgi:hypothetical protein